MAIAYTGWCWKDCWAVDRNEVYDYRQFTSEFAAYLANCIWGVLGIKKARRKWKSYGELESRRVIWVTGHYFPRAILWKSHFLLVSHTFTICLMSWMKNRSICRWIIDVSTKWNGITWPTRGNVILHLLRVPIIAWFVVPTHIYLYPSTYTLPYNNNVY